MGARVSPKIKAGMRVKMMPSNMATSWLLVRVEIKKPMATQAKTMRKVARKRIEKLPWKGRENHHKPNISIKKKSRVRKMT